MIEYVRNIEEKINKKLVAMNTPEHDERILRDGDGNTVDYHLAINQNGDVIISDWCGWSDQPVSVIDAIVEYGLTEDRIDYL